MRLLDNISSLAIADFSSSAGCCGIPHTNPSYYSGMLSLLDLPHVYSPLDPVMRVLVLFFFAEGRTRNPVGIWLNFQLSRTA